MFLTSFNTRKLGEAQDERARRGMKEGAGIVCVKISKNGEEMRQKYRKMVTFAAVWHLCQTECSKP